MSEGNRGEGRKRPRNPSQSRQQKKAKRLSSIALRALAALESDISSEDEGVNESIDEGDTTGNQQKGESHLGPRAPSKRVELNEESSEIRPESTIDSNDTPVAVLRGTKISKVRIPGDVAAAEANGPDSRAEIATKKSSFVHTNDQSDEKKNVHGKFDDVGDKNASLNNGKQSVAAAVPHNIDTNQMEEFSRVCQACTVLPPVKDGNATKDEHPVHPHAVVSRFGDVLSSFLSSPFDEQAMLSLHKLKEESKPDKKKNLVRKNTTKWKKDVPITPQKEFIQSIRSKQSSPTQRSYDLTRSISSVAISSEVSSFLVQECSHLFSAPRLLDDVNLSNHHQPRARGEGGALHGTFQNPRLPLPQRDPLHHHVNDGQNTRQLSPPSAASAPTDTLNAHSDIINTAQALCTTADSRKQCTTNQNPKVTTAKAEIKLIKINKGDARKLPVAFGYWLDDNNASKNLAWKGTRNWVAQGKEAVDADALKLGEARAIGSKCAKNITSSGMQAEPTKRKRNATLPQAEPAGIDFPAGWTTRTFERTGKSSKPGKVATYKVWYSPWTKAKFRSKKSALIFVKILGEPGINDEQQAFNLFKGRGHKL